MAAVVTFVMRKGLAETERQSALDRVRSVGGVSHAGAVNPNSKQPDLQRFGFADIVDTANLAEVLGALNNIPEIESAEVPPLRKLS
jgi:hypothetical protein